jgi:acetyl-CoA acetyltransferase
MLATVFAEHFGIRPAYAHAVQVGGATGLAMTMLAHHLVDAGVAKHVLVVGGENRLTGQSRDASIQALAQVGHPDYEVPLGPTIPAYYGLVASRYMHEYGVTEGDLAEFAVLMRKHALAHPGAQFHEQITVADVMASKPVAMPLKLLDCCPVSDGGAAFVVSRERTGDAGVRVRGCAQAHTHQHVTAAPRLSELGAEIAIAKAKAASGVAMSDVRPSTTALRSRWRCCWKIWGWPNAVRRRRGSDQAISTAMARCRSTPMGGCSATAIAASAVRWHIWSRRICR